MRSLNLQAGMASLGLFLALAAAPAASAQWLVPTSSVYTYRASTLLPSYYATAYTIPTSYVPTSYVGTSYVPTAYYSTAYLPTSYVPTSYVPTSYVSTGYYPTAYYSPTSYYLPTSYYNSYLPTAYYVPTVANASLVATSAQPCADSPAQTVPTSTNSPRKSNGTKIESTTKAIPSNVDSPRPKPLVVEPPLGVEPAPAAAPAPVDPRTPIPGGDSPPRPDVPDDVPVAPPLTNRVEKPKAPSRVVLMGHVYDHPEGARLADSKSFAPIEGVEVTVATQATPKAFVDRRTMTDALGRFAITIPDGDWEVSVPDRKGKAVSQKITISGGVITTDKGREIPSIDFIR